MSKHFWWVGLFIKHKLFKMFLIVPLGFLHIDFSPNSLTLISSAKYDIAKRKIILYPKSINLLNPIPSNLKFIWYEQWFDWWWVLVQSDQDWVEWWFFLDPSQIFEFQPQVFPPFGLSLYNKFFVSCITTMLCFYCKLTCNLIHMH